MYFGMRSWRGYRESALFYFILFLYNDGDDGEFALPFLALSRLFHFVQFVQCCRVFLAFISKGLYRSSGEKKKVVALR